VAVKTTNIAPDAGATMSVRFPDFTAGPHFSGSRTFLFLSHALQPLKASFHQIDGRDVLPTLTKGEKSPHDAALCSQAPTHAALRRGDWKLQMNSSADDGAESDEVAPKKNAKAKAQPNTIKPCNLATQEPEHAPTMRAKLTEMLQDTVQPGHSGNKNCRPRMTDSGGGVPPPGL